MNIKLKPIAESKVRQLGGDVCGVLVRTDGGVMAVSEHGRCTRLDAGVMGPVDGAQGGQGAEPAGFDFDGWYDKHESLFRGGAGKSDLRAAYKQGYRDSQPQPAVPEWLLEMSRQMREQPNRMTAHPFWQVRCKRYLPTMEGYSEHHRELCGDEGVIYRSIDPVDDLHEYLLEEHEDWCKQWAEANHPGEDYVAAVESWFDPDNEELPEGLVWLPVQEVEEVVTTHLTQADAEWFIKRKQHDYPALYTFVESAYWSPQLRQLQDWIISLATTPQADGWVRCEDIEPTMFWDADNSEENYQHEGDLADHVSQDLRQGETMTVTVLCAKELPKRTMKIWINSDGEAEFEWMPQPPAGQEGA